MPNILIIENDQPTAKNIYIALKDNFPNCNCYPISLSEDDFPEMQDLIDDATMWEEETDPDKKERLKNGLGEFLKKEILKKETPDYAIIDVSLKDDTGQDILGAQIRCDILKNLFPALKVIYSTRYDDEVLLDPAGNPYNLGDDHVVKKTELGYQRSFKEILVDAVEKHFGLQRVHQNHIVLRSADMPLPPQKISFPVRLRGWDVSLKEFILFVCSVLKMSAIFASILFYVAGLGVLLFDFLRLFLFNRAKSTIEDILKIVEKLYIIPLPMIIVTGISVFIDQVIITRFSPEYRKFQPIEGNSKYYINLSKSLFVSTLLSLLAIKLIEESFPKGPEMIITWTWQQFSILGACILVLFAFYILIARSLHNLLKPSSGHS